MIIYNILSYAQLVSMQTTPWWIVCCLKVYYKLTSSAQMRYLLHAYIYDWEFAYCIHVVSDCYLPVVTSHLKLRIYVDRRHTIFPKPTFLDTLDSVYRFHLHKLYSCGTIYYLQLKKNWITFQIVVLSIDKDGTYSKPIFLQLENIRWLNWLKAVVLL